MDDELLDSRVPRALEMKTKLFGFELPDLLLIFLNLSIANLVFGASAFRPLLVWGTTLGLALFLFFAKRGRADGYLQHLGEFLTKPSYRAAGQADLKYRRFKKG
jgi:hypothetical protein